MPRKKIKNSNTAKSNVEESNVEEVLEESKVEENTEQYENTDNKVDENTEKSENNESSKHPIDYVFESFVSQNLTVASKELSSAAFNLIVSLNSASKKDNGNDIIKTIEKNFNETYKDQLKENALGLPSLYWTGSYEALSAYETLISVIIAIRNDQIANLSPVSVLSGFKEDYRSLGDKIYNYYFA